MKKFSVFQFAILFSLFSCGSTNNLNKVFVTNTNRVDILPTNSITSEIDEYYLFEGTFGDKKFNATLNIQADSNGIDILILNDFGVEMGSISYDGMNATMNCNLFPKKIKPEYILLDLQNVFADFEVLKNHYQKYNLDFEEITERCLPFPAEINEPQYFVVDRILSKKERNIEIIENNTNSRTVTIKNLLRDYEYKLTKAEE